MFKKFFRSTLKKLKKIQLLQILSSWKIESLVTDRSSLINDIYNHHQNNLRQTIKQQRVMCDGGEVGRCLLKNCPFHLQPRTKKINKQNPKLRPTKFHRNPLPICWFVAGCQFLAVIDWPASFNNFLRKHNEHLFSQFFKLIQLAKSDVTSKTFKTAPIASEFINVFKTNLTANEIDWNLSKNKIQLNL